MTKADSSAGVADEQEEFGAARPGAAAAPQWVAVPREGQHCPAFWHQPVARQWAQLGKGICTTHSVGECLVHPVLSRRLRCEACLASGQPQCSVACGNSSACVGLQH